jgi:hypothetical protein
MESFWQLNSMLSIHPQHNPCLLLLQSAVDLFDGMLSTTSIANTSIDVRQYHRELSHPENDLSGSINFRFASLTISATSDSSQGSTNGVVLQAVAAKGHKAQTF